jgi:hypothetical protein
MTRYKYFLYKRSIITRGSTHKLLHSLAPVSYICKLNEEHGLVCGGGTTVINKITEEFVASSKIYDVN